MPWYVITRGAVRVAAGTAALIVALTEPLAAQALRSSTEVASTPWAVVAPDGSLRHGSASVVSSARLNVGEYAVIFNKRVSGCAFNASARPETDSMIVATARLGGNSAGVLVRVWNSAGASRDGVVHLQLSCGRRALFAVVDSTGVLKRGRHIVSTQALGNGRYQVFFDQDVSACAFKATVGSVNAASPTPGYATVARRVDHTVAVVQTSNLAGAGSNQSFHLAVSCSGVNALVNADGTLAGGSNVIESHWELVFPHYVVTFNRDVSGCSWVATIGEGISRGVPAPAPIDVNGNPDDPRGILVFVGELGGGDYHQQGPFHLVVNC